MQSITNKIYAVVKEELARQAYREAKTMNREILVRACVIRYSQRNGINEKLLKFQVATEMSNGFLWIDKLVDQLAIYEQNRDKYPTLKDYMPEIVKLENRLSPKQLQIDFEAKCAKIVSINIPDSSKNIDPNITEIKLTFDRPMSIYNNGVGYGKKGKEYFPEFNKNKKAKWNIETKKEWTVYVELKSDMTYSLSFPAQFFIDENGYPLDKTYFLDFTTKK